MSKIRSKRAGSRKMPCFALPGVKKPFHAWLRPSGESLTQRQAMGNEPESRAFGAAILIPRPQGELWNELLSNALLTAAFAEIVTGVRQITRRRKALSRMPGYSRAAGRMNSLSAAAVTRLVKPGTIYYSLLEKRPHAEHAAHQHVFARQREMPGPDSRAPRHGKACKKPPRNSRGLCFS